MECHSQYFSESGDERGGASDVEQCRHDMAIIMMDSGSERIGPNTVTAGTDRSGDSSCLPSFIATCHVPKPGARIQAFSRLTGLAPKKPAQCE